MDEVKKRIPDIKIFVSHRTDKVSETIDNPLYVNVRCGAVYDKENKSGLIGDDTGDNISTKKYQYSELTVQYWAWKNVKADYYGLCHYRRYLSFDKEKYLSHRNDRNEIECKCLNKFNAQKYGLLHLEHMQNMISQYDVIVNEPFKVSQVIELTHRGKTVKEHLESFAGYMFPAGAIDRLISILEKYHPAYYEDCQSYLSGECLYGYNLFVIQKDLFKEFCTFEFDVLKRLEKTIDSTYFSETMMRTMGFMGEILYGTFIHYIKRQPKYKIKELPIVLFLETKKIDEIHPAFGQRNIPIVLLSSKYYVPYVAALIESIKEHSVSTNGYDIIIFHKEIDEELQEKLTQGIINSHNMSIRFFDVSTIIDDSKLFVASQYYSVEAYYRILTPWILQNYNKAIVMDCDLILNTDIANLFALDVDNVSFGAVKDFVYQGFLNGFDPESAEYAQNVLKLKRPYDYVNTGVMLMNLEHIRKNYTEQETVNFFRENHFRIQEQDGLNVFFEGDIKFLDLKWNYYVEVQPAIKWAITWAPQKSQQAYRGINPYYKDKAPYIIHYASQPKPWINAEVKHADIWWKYAKNTDFYHICLYRMMQATHPLIQQVSFARKVADKLLPKGTKRRDMLKSIIPKDSPQWNFLKKLYHLFSLD